MIGCLKAMLGLGPSLFAAAYHTFLAPHAASLLLLLAFAPAAIVGLCSGGARHAWLSVICEHVHVAFAVYSPVCVHRIPLFVCIASRSSNSHLQGGYLACLGGSVAQTHCSSLAPPLSGCTCVPNCTIVQQQDTPSAAGRSISSINSSRAQ